MESEIASYLRRYEGSLESLYTWTFDPAIPAERFGIVVEGNSWLERTKDLRRKLFDRVQQADSQEELVAIAEYFIQVWGGIGRFGRAKDVVNKFALLVNTTEYPADFPMKFDSISSWSKWAALVCPAWACIYDARVAYSLNAINLMYGSKHKIFIAPPGRNSRITLLDATTLLVASKLTSLADSSPKSIRKAYFVPKSETYIHYLRLMKKGSVLLFDDPSRFHEVEMLLFAIADTDIYSDLVGFVAKQNERVRGAESTEF
ncbi:MAG: hypothetical protein PsegKO_13660 [Pseudohongiellaceae bacterium]